MAVMLMSSFHEYRSAGSLIEFGRNTTTHGDKMAVTRRQNGDLTQRQTGDLRILLFKVAKMILG
jgi:hypothetical protein